MGGYHLPPGDVEWHAKGRKRPVAYSTTATRDALAIIAEEHARGMTVGEFAAWAAAQERPFRRGGRALFLEDDLRIIRAVARHMPEADAFRYFAEGRLD